MKGCNGMIEIDKNFRMMTDDELKQWIRIAQELRDIKYYRALIKEQNRRWVYA